jgi:hypothetical protein
MAGLFILGELMEGNGNHSCLIAPSQNTLRSEYLLWVEKVSLAAYGPAMANYYVMTLMNVNKNRQAIAMTSNVCYSMINLIGKLVPLRYLSYTLLVAWSVAELGTSLSVGSGWASVRQISDMATGIQFCGERLKMGTRTLHWAKQELGSPILKKL